MRRGMRAKIIVAGMIAIAILFFSKNEKMFGSEIWAFHNNDIEIVANKNIPKPEFFNHSTDVVVCGYEIQKNRNGWYIIKERRFGWCDAAWYENFIRNSYVSYCKSRGIKVYGRFSLLIGTEVRSKSKAFWIFDDRDRFAYDQLISQLFNENAGSSRQKVAELIADKVNKLGLDGANIDIEMVGSINQAYFTDFIAKLNAEIKVKLSKSVTVDAVAGSVYTPNLHGNGHIHYPTLTG